MITDLDHLVILVRDIEAGVAGHQILLGRAPSWRVEKDGVATAIFTLGNVSLEVMAPAGEGAGGERVLAALDEQGEGLASLAFGVGDIAKAHKRLARLGLSPDDISDGESRDLSSGRTMTWKRTRASSESTHGVRLFFLQRTERLAPSPAIVPVPADILDHLVISTPNPERTAALYGGRLDLDMRLDRTISALSTRFLFFRVGGLVLEVIHPIKDGESSGPDKIFGVTWRVANLEASRTRLTEAGLEVSELREGRKPGTRVFTVRTGTFGVPTLMIEQRARES